MAKTGAPSLINNPVLSTSLFRRYIVAKLAKLAKVNDSFTINRYDNGWMVEIGGRDNENEWATAKVICNSEDDLIAVIKEYNTTTLAD